MMKKNTPVENNSVNIIGKGTAIIGNLMSDGDIRIDGNLEGNIKATGKVIIGKTGSTKGDINCTTLDISGSIIGKINVTELLSLKASANVEGDIITQKITIEPGAVLNGTCKMGKGIEHKTTFDAEKK